MYVTRRPSGGLDERASRAQESLLVRVQDGHERDLGQIQSLPEKIYADEAVELAPAEIPDYLHALDGLDLRMEILGADADALDVDREVLSHFFRERGHQHALVPRGAHAYLADEIVHLVCGGAHLDRGIDEAGGTYHLLRDLSAHGDLIVGGSGGDEDRLVDGFLELFEMERPVVQRRGEAEPVLNQVHLARAVSLEHAAHLGNGHV